jgi:hypothetical protein
LRADGLIIRAQATIRTVGISVRAGSAKRCARQQRLKLILNCALICPK